MIIKQVYTECLSQGSYYIESKGEAAIIDPLREVDNYIDMAKKRGACIKYIFETHFHADFVSGHVTLSERTGAKIVFGPNAETQFDALIGKDLEEFTLGDITIRLLHTPGHTMESSSYLLIDEEQVEVAVFSGDTLFLGDVGRPDLAQTSDVSVKDLAGMLFDSLRNKIMPLSDDVVVYPGHGAGSACGKNMSQNTIGSIGDEKQYNYALRADMTKEEFIEEVTEGLSSAPLYFSDNVMLNKTGYIDVNSVIERGSKAFSVKEFKQIYRNEKPVLLDVRHQSDFVKGFVPGSIFIGIDGSFAPWVGKIIKDRKRHIFLVSDDSRIEEAITRLSRVGFENIYGYLEGGINTWNEAGEEVDTINSISPNQFEYMLKKNKQSNIIDVRTESEFLLQHVMFAKNAPLSLLHENNLNFFSTNNFIYCAGGYRSVIACSLLKQKGVATLTNVEGGFTAIRDLNVKLADSV